MLGHICNPNFTEAKEGGMKDFLHCKQVQGQCGRYETLFHTTEKKNARKHNTTQWKTIMKMDNFHYKSLLILALGRQEQMNL